MARTVIQFRCSDELKEKVEELARIENRTISNYIIHLIEKEYEKNVKEKGK